MIFDTRGSSIPQIRHTLTVALTPVQYMVSMPVQWTGKIAKIVTTQDALIKENHELRSRELLLKSQVQRLLAVESENSQLKALMRSSAQVQGKVLIAQLMAIDSDPFVHQVIVDKGSRDNVFVGQPVLDANGVMGKVIQVGLLTSRVLLVNDPHSGVPAQIARNGLRAIAMGDNFTGKLRLVNIPLTSDVRKNDVIVTSGLGEHFPEGYPLGVVTDVSKDPSLQFAVITVEPSAELDRAREVLLVWPNKRLLDKKAVATDENKAVENKSAENKSDETKPEENKSTTNSSEKKSSEKKSSEKKSAEKKSGVSKING